MFRALCLILTNILLFTASAEAADPTPPLMEWIVNDESKPPAERSVAIVVGLHSLANQATADPAISELGDEARTYAAALKAHGGFDAIVLLEDEAVTVVNVRRALFSLIGDGRAFPAPKYVLMHWAGPALDDFFLMAHDNNNVGYQDPGGVPLDVLELYLWPMRYGHVVITFDTPPGPPGVVSPKASQFSVTKWESASSAAIGASPGCNHFTRVLTQVVESSFGRRLSINELAAEVTKTCGAAPVVHAEEVLDNDDRPIPRLADSATMIPLGDVRPMPTPVPTTPVPAPPSPEPLAVVPDPEPIIGRERKLPRGVGYALTGAGVVMAGLSGYEVVRFGDALEVRNTTLDADEYAQATKQANTAVVGAGVLGTLGLGSLTVGLVVTF